MIKKDTHSSMNGFVIAINERFSFIAPSVANVVVTISFFYFKIDLKEIENEFVI